MQSTTSFFGKCVTILIGMGLSWATMTNPEIEQVARRLLGQQSPTVAASPATTDFAPMTDELHVPPNKTGADEFDWNAPFAASPIEQPTAVSVAISEPPPNPPIANQFTLASTPPPQMTEEQELAVLSDELRELGASYLRVEKLSGKAAVWYRVRCDVAQQPEQVKCCFEATRETAVAALHDVLHAVREVATGSPNKVAAST